ncbi:MAG: hypothetical protein LRY63_01830 [Nitrincola sp.]|nr:hypothetical protein [Nitrincola sp.]
MVETLFGFPLTRHQRDTAQGIELSYWLVTDQGPRCVTLPGQEAVFFRSSTGSCQNRAGA